MGLSNRAAQYGQAISSQAFTPDAAQLLPSIPSNAKSALFSAGGQIVRWRADGTAPTTAVGHPIAANGNIEFFENDLAAVRVINAVAGGACFVTYFKD